MSGHYKLIIQNKNKFLLKEGIMQYHFKQDVLPVFQDILKTASNVVQATIISLGASIEYQIITNNVRGFASLKGINKKFEEKIAEANKLYRDAIPESVRGDVELLFGMTNPAVIMSQRLTDSIADSKGLDNYIPFWWFTKYLMDTKSGFFKNDVKDFGDLFGFKFNNIVWFKGWIYQDLIIDNIEWFRTDGFKWLQDNKIEGIIDVKDWEEFEKKYRSVGLFMRAYKVFQSVTKPVVEYYNFCKQWTPAVVWGIMQGVMEEEELRKQVENETEPYSNARLAQAKYEWDNASSGSDKKTKYDEYEKIRVKNSDLNERLTAIKKKNEDNFVAFKGSVQLTMVEIVKAEKNVIGDTVSFFTGEKFYNEKIGPNLYRSLYVIGNILNVPIDMLEQFANKMLGTNFDFPSVAEVVPRGDTIDLGKWNPLNWFKEGINTKNIGKLIINNHNKRLIETVADSRPTSAASVSSIKNNTNTALVKNVGVNKDKKINPDMNNQIMLDDIEELKELGLTKYQPNRAEEIILKNLIDNKKVNKYTEQWMELSKLSKSVANKSLEVRKNLFCDMLLTSMKYFDMIQKDLNQGFDTLKNDRSGESKKINSELQKNFNFEMTPQGFGQKISYDFELLCNINTIYAGSYLNNLKFIFEKNNLLYHFLKGTELNDVRSLIGSLRNNITNYQQLDLNDVAIKKLESINKEIIKLFGEKSRTFEIFTSANNNLKESITNNKEFLLNFCNEMEKTISDFEKLSDQQKLVKLNDMTFEFVKTLDINLNQIYDEFLPSLKKLKENFEQNIGKRKDILKNDFDKLLVKMDLQSFDSIYTGNKSRFDKKYNECIQYIGQSRNGSKLSNYLEELKVKQQEYEKKIAELKTQMQTVADEEKMNVDTIKPVSKNKNTSNQKGPEKVNIETNSLNPVSVDDNSEIELEKDIEEE